MQFPLNSPRLKAKKNHGFIKSHVDYCCSLMTVHSKSVIDKS